MARRLTAVLRSDVSPMSRGRGHAYFDAGRVSAVEISPTIYRAIVRGTHPYQVTLALDGNRLDVACTCPRFLDTFEPCKHVWAAMLDADRAGAMTPPVDLWLDVTAD